MKNMGILGRSVRAALVVSFAAAMLLALLPAAPAQAAQRAPKGANLLGNGGAEEGDLSGWTDSAEEEDGSGTFTVTDEYVWGSSVITPAKGSYFFFAGATPGNAIYQDVDVRDYPDGTVFTLSGFMNGWETDHGDNSYLELDFLNKKGKSLGSDRVCEPSIAGWDLYSVSLEKPEGAVTARVSLIAERNTGSDCDSYFDEISLTAAVPSEKPDEKGGAEKDDTEKDVSDFEVIWTNFNTDSVQNGAPDTVELEVVDEVCIEAITTYHWNNGNGKTPGTISILEDGEEVGSWEASGRSGSGADNVNWDVFPDIVLKAGHTYEFEDSSPKTWSCNDGSDGEGFLEIRGYFTDEEDGIEPNYELSWGEGDEPTTYINPVRISCDAENGELTITYVNEDNYFGDVDIDDPGKYSDEQGTTLYRRDSKGRWKKMSRITTEIVGADDARDIDGAYGTIRLKFYQRKKDISFDEDEEYAVSFDVCSKGHHMTPEDADMFELADAAEPDEDGDETGDAGGAKGNAGKDTGKDAGKDTGKDAGEIGSGLAEGKAGEGPESYAISGGTWDILQSGEKVYHMADGTDVRNVWVRDGSQYFYIDFSGCMMKDCYTSDGYWVAGDGSWMKSVAQRTDDPEPLDGRKYGKDPYWTFKIMNYSDGSHYAIATKTYSFGYEEKYDVTPLGHGGYLLENVEDSTLCCQVSVSSDKNSIIVSGSGITEDYTLQ